MSLPAKLAEQWRLWVARLACFAGLRAFARNVLKSAVRRNPVSFRARFLLGRLYLFETAVTKARREFDLAWQIDPDRFEAAYARLKARFRGAPELLAALAATGELPWEEPGTEAGAARLATAAGARLLHPVEANALFVRLSAAERAALRAEGFAFYDWEADGPDAVRLVVRWDQSAGAIEALAERLSALP